MSPPSFDAAVEKAKMARGELYTAFIPELIAEREVAARACKAFNNAPDGLTRREKTELLARVIPSLKTRPPKLEDPEEDEEQFDDFPWVEAPLRVDYGTHVTLGDNTFINFGAIFIDDCEITIGARTLVGPNVQFYAGGHPLDPGLRNGLLGPDFGKPITIGEDAWIAGNVTILPGVTIGKGSTVGAGSVVTKDVGAFEVWAGNPARLIRKIECSMVDTYHADLQGANSTWRYSIWVLEFG